MGIIARDKGHGFEREIAIRLREVFPRARRQLEYQIQDCKGVDIAETGHYRIQCKRLKKYVNPSKIEEIQLQMPEVEIPVLITKADRKPALAVLPLDVLIRLLTIAETFAYDTVTKTYVKHSR